MRLIYCHLIIFLSISSVFAPIPINVRIKRQEGNSQNPPLQPQPPPSRRTIGSLCSLFQTFLDTRRINCQVSQRQQQTPPQHQQQLQQQQQHEENELNDHQYIDDDGRDMSINDEIDEDDIGSNEDSQQNHKIDETKILKSKTMIIVPDRPCRTGQRRDARGYCRKIVRYRTNQFGQPQNNYNNQNQPPRSHRYYYKRLISVPTLHFILPQ